MCFSVLLAFWSPFLGKRELVFVLNYAHVNLCHFPPGFGVWLRVLLVALPGLFCLPFWIHCLFEIHNIAVCFLWFSLPGHYSDTGEALLAETTYYDPSSFLWMFSLLLKELIFLFLYTYTAVGVVQCGGRDTSPRTSTIVQFICYVWSFEISENTLRNQK